MMCWFGIVASLMVGGTLGALAMAMCAVAGDADRRAGLK
jgi:hypothetical protein